MTTNYSAFNLNIHSQVPLPLPEVEQSGTTADVNIEVAELHPPETLQRTDDGVWYAYGEDSLYLRWDEIGSFLLEKGERILLSPARGVAPEQQPVVPLLGTVIGSLMQQKGMMVIHGSCVSIEGKAVIFVGRKGQGKSTFAGYFSRMSHKLVSDDICALSLQEQRDPLIHPSFSSIKLWPDAMNFLEFDPADYKRVHPEYEKRVVSFESNFHNNSIKVDAIVELAIGAEIDLELQEGQRRVQAILPHLIINRFPDGQPDSLRTEIFLNITGKMKNVPVYRLTRPRDKKLLPQLAKLVMSTLK